MTEGEFCTTNITPAGRRRRMVMGVVVLAATVGGVVWFQGALVVTLAALVPLAFGWLCVLQAKENT